MIDKNQICVSTFFSFFISTSIFSANDSDVKLVSAWLNSNLIDWF